MIELDPKAASALAGHLSRLRIPPERFLPPLPLAAKDRTALANFWFYLVAICQHTVGLQGTIAGRRLRGWDYLEAAARRKFELFTAERLLSLTARELQAVFSDCGDPELSTLDRVEERLGQLHECARLLLSQYAGDVNEIYRRSKGRLIGPGGIIEALSHFGPYSDPIRKKSFLFLEMVSASGLWDLKDPQALHVPVDYHVMRIALRSGLVRVSDPHLDRVLRSRAPVNEELDQFIRARIEAACDLLVKESGHSVFEVDMLLWHIGRSCCYYPSGPCCSGCTEPANCSLAGALGACPDRCPLDGACAASRDPSYREYRETNIYTAYY